jgi:hypothetical protein
MNKKKERHEWYVAEPKRKEADEQEIDMYEKMRKKNK